jgi:hypothetical protein
VLELSDQPCAASAEALFTAEDVVRHLWVEARDIVKTLIRTELRRRKPDDQTTVMDILPTLRVAAKASEKHRLSEELRKLLPDELVRDLSQRMDQVRELKGIFAERFVQAKQSTTVQIRTLARDALIQEAMTWQNRRLVVEILGGLDDRSTTASRRREDIVASYLQRYCVKNDTIGFFGPVGWAYWCDGPHTVQIHLGQQQLSNRNVYFEDWAVQALADRFSVDSRLFPWMVPTRAPFIRQEGRALVLPAGQRIVLTEEESVAFGACNGQLTVHQIASALLINPFLKFADETQVFDVIRSLARNRRIRTTLEVCLSDARPERRLRTDLERIEDSGFRAEALASLNRLEAAREDVAAAAGDASRLAEALIRLDQVFEEETGIDSVRNGGQTYGARTVAYEDCQRAAQVILGQPLLDQLQPPLDLILTSARWLCHEMAAAFRIAFLDVFEQLIREAKSPSKADQIDLSSFWLGAQHLFYGDGPPTAREILSSLQSKWADLLQLEPGRLEVSRTTDGLINKVMSSFALPNHEQIDSIHYCPDVMIAATSPEAIDHGECLFVLGEIHVGTNTLACHSAAGQHDSPISLLNALFADLGRGRIIPLISRSGTQQPIRVQMVTDTRHDIELVCSLDARPLDVTSALALSELWVRRSEGRLEVCSDDGERSFDAMKVFSQLLSGFIADKFQISTLDRQSPRISIDRLVIQRRTWRIPYAELAFMTGHDDSNNYLELKRWAAETGLPRFTFTKLYGEKKPFYLDLDSPIFVRILAKQVRKTLRDEQANGANLTFSEMLPAHDQLWMPLVNDTRCTSELRFVAVHSDDRVSTRH